MSLASETPEGVSAPAVRSFAELHRDVWRVVRTAPAVFVLVPAVLWLPIDVLLELAVRRLDGDWLAELRFITRAGTVLEAIVGTLVTAIFLAALRDLGAGRQISTRRAVQEGFKLWGRIVVVYISAAIRIGLATLLLIIPGIYLALRYVLATPAAIFEDKSGVAALEASAAYMKGRYWRVAGFLGLVLLIYPPLALAPIMLTPNSMSPWLIALTELPLDILVSFYTIGATLLYADFRTDHSLKPPVARPDPMELQFSTSPRVSGRRGVAITAACSLGVALTAIPLWTWLATQPIEAGDEAWEREAYEEALKHYQRAAYWDPEDAYVQYSLGWAYYQLDGLSLSARHFARAVKLEPKIPGYRYDHARVLSDLGQLQSARFELVAAKKLGYPDNEALEAFLTELDTRLEADPSSEELSSE